jgi:nucleotide-binding universal stress UspA family protein
MKKVLIAVDDTKDSTAVFSVFNNLVRPPEEVVLLNVQGLEGKSMMIDMLGDAEISTLKECLEGSEHMEMLERESMRILDYYRKQMENGGLIRVKAMSRFGIASDEILKVADEEGAELIIMGFSGRKGLDRLIAGRLSKDIEKSARVPVMLARHPEGAGKQGLEKAVPQPLVLKVELS